METGESSVSTTIIGGFERRQSGWRTPGRVSGPDVAVNYFENSTSIAGGMICALSLSWNSSFIGKKDLKHAFTDQSFINDDCHSIFVQTIRLRLIHIQR